MYLWVPLPQGLVVVLCLKHRLKLWHSPKGRARKRNRGLQFPVCLHQISRSYIVFMSSQQQRCHKT